MTAYTSSRQAKRAAYIPSIELLSGVLAGSVPAIARMISRAEGGYAEASDALAEIYRHTGKAHIVGITGVPGAGKSTLVSSLIKAFASDGYKVGVIAVDPSSPFSGGAILGDRVRMNDAAQSCQAFVRSMATRGHLGGLARSTLQAVDILDAAGYSPIIIETVGVGQDEVEVVTAAHTIVVLSAPGLGDDIQAIKAGILEIADIHAVSKCDKPEASATVSALKGMMALGTVKASAGWNPPVLPVSSVSGERIGDLKDGIGQHWAHLQESGELAERQRSMCRTRILGTARHLFQLKFNEDVEEMEKHIQAVVNRDVDPLVAAYRLLGWDSEARVA
ncbi:methylmalonyl Co-A mutase-associated GTPase MeaB [Mesorhizobium sp. M7D.F.Ca.US.005.01.1.1]|jgi:LAO/AO transport system kinase|uniref:LAO/AO transport system kinase n=1 Tax=Rhizobium loti TaxID=381 RepID=A0A8E3B654_RHILI|nr:MULTISPECIES: methylmalonyl Co-A mutase-associated GTPase MeaB [Mesorhizobium]AZO41906.1 methylmalonyl Co-A mutase-associated GTPase MeaB [Mesorhizobium sp. M7D.F.Ca.US.005.01.1.1]PWJ92258.1 LAO/AO transport system kinase [Mesorhizobium loti]